MIDGLLPKKLKLIPETQYSTKSDLTQTRLAFFNSSPSYDSAAKAVLNQMIKIMPPALLSISEANRTAIDKILSTNTRQTVMTKSASAEVIKTLGTILKALQDTYNIGLKNAASATLKRTLVFSEANKKRMLLAIVGKGWNTGYIQDLVDQTPNKSIVN